MSDPADAKEFARPLCGAQGVPWSMYERQVQQESGWQHWSSPGVVKTSSGNAKGLGQIVPSAHPSANWADPYENLRYSIGLMASHFRRFGSWRKALAAYNWGPGHVGGGFFGGQQHSPWDGTRDWQCSAGHGVSEQCKHYLDVILGPGWPEPVIDDGNGPITELPMIVYEDYRDPEPAGRFAAMPKGIILHGSRSGIAGNPKDKEYLATARYEQSNPNDLGWHATIGENKVALHLTPQEWGWHALQASKVYMGVEFAQAVEGEPITDGQVAALVDWIKTRVLPVWPSLPLHFPSHAEADREQGVSQGKTDAFRLGDPRMDALRARIMVGLRGGVTGVPDKPIYAVGPGILSEMQARNDEPATHEMYFKHGEQDMYSEAYGRSGSRYLYLFSLNRVFRYDPAA